MKHLTAITAWLRARIKFFNAAEGQVAGRLAQWRKQVRLSKWELARLDERLILREARGRGIGLTARLFDALLQRVL